jgi:transposase InsO family protein
MMIVTAILENSHRKPGRTACTRTPWPRDRSKLVWHRNWQTRREVEVALFEYINGVYNPRRKHSALGWKSPVAFEQRAA